MLIAQEKRKSNIAEYVLYMWQIEDIIRATGFDMNRIEEKIIRQYEVNASTREEIRAWYEGLVEMMVRDRLTQTGHLYFVEQLVAELNRLHRNLLAKADETDYQQLYAEAKNDIAALIERQPDKSISEIELCFNALYGLLMLRLKKASISAETTESLKNISNLLGGLTQKYHLSKKTS